MLAARARGGVVDAKTKNKAQFIMNSVMNVFSRLKKAVGKSESIPAVKRSQDGCCFKLQVSCGGG